jgi:thiol:disulfide interchange protein DsbD
MKQKWWLLLAVVVVVMIIFVAVLRSSPKNSLDEDMWMSYSDGLDLARSKGMPALIYFTQEGCVWCERLEKDVFSDSAVMRNIAQSFVLIKVDINSEKDLTAEYGVKGTPTLLIVDGNGSVMVPVNHGWFYDGKNFDKNQFLNIMTHIYKSLSETETQ